MQSGKPKTLSRAGMCMAALLGLAIVLFLLRGGLHYLASGQNDYLQLYAGARLVGTPQLYDLRKISRVQMESAGFYGESLGFNRAPFYAVLLWPLGKLPYRQSYLLWQALCVCALLGFILLWRTPGKEAAMAACCWSLPLILALAHGQDLTFLLLLIAAALLIHPKRSFAAGVLLSLCAIKVHLFLLLPLVMVAQRRWRMLGGLLAGGAFLTAVSFAAAGARWPFQYFEMLSQVSDPEQQIMPNFHGMLLGIPYRHSIEALLALATAAIVWLIARRTDFEYGLAAALTGGLLISVHANPQDCTLLLPALLIVIHRSSDWRLNYLCIALFTPWTYLVLIQGDKFNLVRMAFVGLLLGMALQSQGDRVGTLRHV